VTKNTQIKFVTGPGSPLLLKGTRQVGRSDTLQKQVILDFSLIINFGPEYLIVMGSGVEKE